MAKPQDKVKEQKEEIVEAAPMRPSLGAHVLYHKSTQSQTGARMETFPAIVCGFPKSVGNFQEKDLAVDLVIFGQPGVAFDHRQGVLFSNEPATGRWTAK